MYTHLVQNAHFEYQIDIEFRYNCLGNLIWPACIAFEVVIFLFIILLFRRRVKLFGTC